MAGNMNQLGLFTFESTGLIKGDIELTLNLFSRSLDSVLKHDGHWYFYKPKVGYCPNYRAYQVEFRIHTFHIQDFFLWPPEYHSLLLHWRCFQSLLLLLHVFAENKQWLVNYINTSDWEEQGMCSLLLKELFEI